MVMTMKRYKAKRSNLQNNYYFGAIIPAVRQGLIDMGFEAHLLSAESTHELLKAKFLKRDIANDDGLFITVTLSTSDLNKTEFGDYIDAIDRFCQEFCGFPLPLPEQQQKINY
jgi:predicted sulfurtransferase